jgi:hypothetical protein
MAGRVGVRVWKDRCRTLTLQRGRWVEYGVSNSIPVEGKQLDSKTTGVSSLGLYVNQIELALSEVGRSELRQLIIGELPLEEALEGELLTV